MSRCAYLARRDNLAGECEGVNYTDSLACARASFLFLGITAPLSSSAYNTFPRRSVPYHTDRLLRLSLYFLITAWMCFFFFFFPPVTIHRSFFDVDVWLAVAYDISAFVLALLSKRCRWRESLFMIDYEIYLYKRVAGTRYFL